MQVLWLFFLFFSEKVKFCGYSLPHPTERRVIMQIQTYPHKGVTALQAFERGLHDLLELSEAVKKKFEDTLKEASPAGTG